MSISQEIHPLVEFAFQTVTTPSAEILVIAEKRHPDTDGREDSVNVGRTDSYPRMLAGGRTALASVHHFVEREARRGANRWF